MAKKPGKKKPPTTTEAVAGTLKGALAGVSTGAGAGTVVGPWLAKITILAAFDPTLLTPIVLGTLGAAVGGYLGYKEKKAGKK